MPRYDGRGPLGEGPMTGRRMGRCVVNDDQTVTVTENIVPVYGRGREDVAFEGRGMALGFGRGMGRGGGRMPMGGRGMARGAGRGMALGGRGMRCRAFGYDSRRLRP